MCRSIKISEGGGGGGGGVQLQTRVGQTKFYHYKTQTLENEGRGSRPLSFPRSAHRFKGNLHLSL